MHEQIRDASGYYYSNTHSFINLSFVIATKNMFGFQRKRQFSLFIGRCWFPKEHL